MHDPSEIPKQKHVTLPRYSYLSKTRTPATPLTPVVAHRAAAGTSESASPEWKDKDLARVVKNPHGRLILYQNPARKHQNMGESGHGSRETIMLVKRRKRRRFWIYKFFNTCKLFRLILTGSFARMYKIEATWSNFTKCNMRN